MRLADRLKVEVTPYGFSVGFWEYGREGYDGDVTGAGFRILRGPFKRRDMAEQALKDAREELAAPEH